MIKLHKGGNFKSKGWKDVVTTCQRVAIDVEPRLITKELLHAIELDILFAADFDLVPVGQIFGGVDENGEDGRTWKFSGARRFRGGEAVEETEVFLARPVERFNQCTGVRVICDTVREVQIFHHWSMYCMVEAAHDSVMAGVYKEFSTVRFADCQPLEAVRLRFAAMARRDHVMAMTASRFSMTWLRCATTAVSSKDVAALAQSRAVLTDVSVFSFVYFVLSSEGA